MSDKNDQPSTVSMADGSVVEDKYLEIEHKWQADHVNWEDFVKFFRRKKKQLINEEIATGPDEYWRQDQDIEALAKRIAESPEDEEAIRNTLEKAGVGQSVVRYRSNGRSFKELTVKRRTSASNTTVRGEADLPLKRVKQSDVGAFLSMLGYKKEVVIHKRCHIFWIENELGIAVPVIYDIWKEGEEDKVVRFVEVEAEKGQSQEQAAKILKFWSKELKDNFNLQNKHKSDLSLYEIFSGRRYWGVNGNDEE